MKTFKVNERYSISQYDSRNWVIYDNETKPQSAGLARYLAQKKAKGNKPRKDGELVAGALKTSKKHVLGYYQTLERAKERLADLVSTQASNFTELEKWIAEIKKV